MKTSEKPKGTFIVETRKRYKEWLDEDPAVRQREARNWCPSRGQKPALKPQVSLAYRTQAAIRLLSSVVDVDKDVRGGIPVMKGTRLKASQVIAQLHDGDTIDDVAEDFGVPRDDIRQLLAVYSIVLDRPYV